MSEHSPGPWQIDYGGMSEDDVGFGISSKIAPGIVAECYPPAAGHDLERRQRLLSDARLICAAPDLLEALQWWVERLENPATVSESEAMAVMTEALMKSRAAIAKATGEKS